MNELAVNQTRYLRWIALSGMFLPITLVIMHGGVLPSLSAYYYSDARDQFVGLLFVLGAALGFYQGYDSRDRVWSAIAGICAPLIATLPMAPDEATAAQELIGWGHFVAAVLFFAALAYFCLRLFPLTDGSPTPEKLKRNRVYQACGYVIVIGIAALAVVANVFNRSPAVFFIETLMIWSFGVAFLTSVL